jgi:hypothetical protein
MNKIWGGLLKNNPKAKNLIDSRFIQEVPGAQKLDTKNRAANVAATFANLIKGGHFDANDENFFNPMIKSVFENPKVSDNKLNTTVGYLSTIKPFYNKYLKAGSPQRLKSDAMRQQYSMLVSTMLLNSGSFVTSEQKKILNDTLKESFMYDNAIPLANLFSGLSAIEDKDPFVGDFLRTFAANNRGTIDFKKKFTDAEDAVKKSPTSGKKKFSVSHSIKNIFKL